MRQRWRLVVARDEGAPESVRRFALRARRRRLRAAVPWLSLAAAGLVALTCWGVIGHTGLFGVRHVEVTGTGRVSVAQVRTAAAVRSGTPLARVNTRAVVRRVRHLAAVRSVSVARRLPDILLIRVTERVPTAVVPLAGGTGFVVVDPLGVGFATLPQRPPDLPVVRVASPSETDPTTRAALTVLRSLPAALRASLGALVAEAPARIRLELTDGRVVLWGDSTENDTKVRVTTLLLARQGRVFDVSAPNLVTVR